MTARAAAPVGRIELKLRDVAQLFHTLDPSPFRERTLDATAEQFIAGWASDVPHRLELELLVHLSEPRKESEAELSALVGEAVRNHFSYLADGKRREYRVLMSRGRTSLAIGLAFLAVCVGLGNAVTRLGASPFFALARESLLIGGWVAMWRPLEIFLYDSWGLRRAARDLTRLARMPVRVVLPK
ncbi:MAG: hypothetical protein ACHQ6T_15360 [Myxococcota bacterium]